MESLFEEIATAIAEQGYFIGRQVLPEAMMRNLQAAALAIPAAEFRPGSIGRALSFNHNPEVRRDSIVWIDDRDPAGAAWLAWCESLRQAINAHLMLGLFSFESHFAHYRCGDFYATHRDAFKGRSNRKLSLVTYLNDHWDESDGGQLVLYRDDSSNENQTSEIARVLPEFGSLVLFLSEDFPHEVRPVKRERWSAVGWFRVRESDR